MSRPTISRPVCLGVKHRSVTQDQIIVTIRQFRLRWCGAPSFNIERVCSLQLTMVLARAVTLGSNPTGLVTIFYCLIWDSSTLEGHAPYLYPQGIVWLTYIPPDTGLPLLRLLRFARLWWRYSIKVTLRPTVSLPVFVSGTHLGPIINFSAF
jgi:hypothetical protein